MHSRLTKTRHLLLVFKVWVYRLRQSVLIRFNRNYIKDSIATRQGHCDSSKCGAICCRGCPHLKRDLLCSVYDRRDKIQACSAESPLDPFEIKWFGWKNCTYYWGKRTGTTSGR